MPDLKLEVGKFYKTRSGRIVEITNRSTNKDTPFPFISVKGDAYTIEGRYSLSSLSGADLIEETETPFFLTDPLDIPGFYPRIDDEQTCAKELRRTKAVPATDSSVTIHVDDRASPLDVIIVRQGTAFDITYKLLTPED